jgi:CheY-like chemotaxis protein
MVSPKILHTTFVAAAYANMDSTKNILLIDDDEDDRWLFAEALARTAPGVRCTTVSGGLEAIELLSDESKPLPDLIFLDLNMPGMDGKKCLAQIKTNRRLKPIPVVVYSTSNFYRDIEETERLGATRFIMKPTEYSQLCNMFREMFDQQ